MLRAWDGKTMWQGRPVVKLEDLKQIECPFPPEPDWAEKKYSHDARSCVIWEVGDQDKIKLTLISSAIIYMMNPEHIM